MCKYPMSCKLLDITQVNFRLPTFDIIFCDQTQRTEVANTCRFIVGRSANKTPLPHDFFFFFFFFFENVPVLQDRLVDAQSIT